MWRMMLAGALAIGGLALTEAPASARPTAMPELIQVTPIQPAAAESAAEIPCHWHRGWHRWGYHPYWHHRWGWHPYRHRWGWLPYYGWHPHYWHHWHHWHRFY